MYYMDFLRVTRALRTYSIVLGCIVILIAISIPLSHVTPHGLTVGIGGDSSLGDARTGLALLHELGKDHSFPIDDFATAAIAFAILFATGLLTSLSRVNESALFAFVKPTSRERSTWVTFGIDAAAIFVAFLIAFVLSLVPFAEVGLLGRITFDSAVHLPATIAFGLGIGLMWYGMVQAATSTLTRGGAILGISWGVFATMRGLGSIPQGTIPDSFYWFIHAFNTINPLVYLQASFSDLHGHYGSLGVVWLVALAALAIATFRRSRMEV
ncbi:MAG: hypothetical protein IAI48_15855 [Candidatus Eremiobacteraeota bacterium]|nr:hypothetical protein [Candidatus Eremiobacteraeota bacterium]